MLALYEVACSAQRNRHWLFQRMRLCTILFDALELGREVSLIPPLLDNPAISRLVTHLTANASSEIPKLEELGKMVGWSPTYLSRRFRDVLGMGPIDYLHHLRIEKACALLVSTDDSIAEIATEVGYNEIPYFNRRFKRRVGVTPTAYRIGRRS